MKYAIDRYEMELEKEVSADIFYNKYIPRKKDRFFCPECGEPVFWSSRGGLQPDKFSHYNKTEQTPECDKRVDGRSGLNETVSIPQLSWGNNRCKWRRTEYKKTTPVV